MEPQRRKRIILEEEEREDELEKLKKEMTSDLMNAMVLSSCQPCLLDSKVILIIVS